MLIGWFLSLYVRAFPVVFPLTLSQTLHTIEYFMKNIFHGVSFFQSPFIVLVPHLEHDVTVMAIPECKSQHVRQPLHDAETDRFTNLSGLLTCSYWFPHQNRLLFWCISEIRETTPKGIADILWDETGTELVLPPATGAHCSGFPVWNLPSFSPRSR